MSVSASIFRFSRALSLVALAAIVCCLCGTAALGAGHPTITLVDDSFTDGGNFNGADPLDTEWYGYRGAQPNDASGPFPILPGTDPDTIDGSNSFLIDRNGTSVTGALADLPGATGGAGNQGTGNNGDAAGVILPDLKWKLVNAGDFIQMDFDYRMLGTPADSNRGFRFGIADRRNLPDILPPGTPDYFEDASFYVKVGTGNNNNLSIEQEYGGSNEVFNGSDSLGVDTTQSAGNLEDNDSLAHAMLKLTKVVDVSTASGFGILAEATVRGDSVSGTFDLNPGPGGIFPVLDSFDMFGVTGAKSGGHDYVVDNVLVVTNGTQVSTISTLTADFDGDDDVDGADFLQWQREFGTLDDTDLANWQNEYGSTAAVTAVSAVPEPLSLVLFGLGALGLPVLSRRRRT